MAGCRRVHAGGGCRGRGGARGPGGHRGGPTPAAAVRSVCGPRRGPRRRRGDAARRQGRRRGARGPRGGDGGSHAGEPAARVGRPHLPPREGGLVGGGRVAGVDPAPDAWTYYEHFAAGGEVLSSWTLLASPSGGALGVPGLLVWASIAVAARSAGLRLGLDADRATLAAAAVATVPAVTVFVESAYVDNLALLGFLVGLASLLAVRAGPSTAGVLVAAASFGLAAGVKQSMLPVAAIAWAWLLAIGWRHRRTAPMAPVRGGRGRRHGGRGAVVPAGVDRRGLADVSLQGAAAGRPPAVQRAAAVDPLRQHRRRGGGRPRARVRRRRVPRLDRAPRRGRPRAQLAAGTAGLAAGGDGRRRAAAGRPGPAGAGGVPGGDGRRGVGPGPPP